MNASLRKLSALAQKPERRIIGLMSGTSLDGLDIALCRFSGSGKTTRVVIEQFETIPFEESVKAEIRKVFAQKNIDFPHLCMLNPWLGNLHGELVNLFLKKNKINPDTIDLIASHGQTVMHAPKRLHENAKFSNATLQIGDADHLAVKTGIITISDFRQKHCAIAGEGAPLALYGDYLLFQGAEENRILVNIGGIANFTFLPSNGKFNEAFATDTGPGNTLIDAFVQRHYKIPYDANAEIALQGSLHEPLLKALCAHPYFEQAIPKTTGPELFNLDYLQNALLQSDSQNIRLQDVLHTLCHFSAFTLIDAIKKNVPSTLRPAVYLSGGGMHNPLVVGLIRSEFVCNNMSLLGVSGDAKEAVLFAAIANESVAGETGFSRPDGTTPNFFMGKVSFPF